MITFINFDGSSVGSLPAGFSNTTTIPGLPGKYQVGNNGSISSPNCLYDASGNIGGSALWTEFLAADEAIQFDQIVSLSGGVMNPLIRMSTNGQTGYGAFISWSTSRINFVVIHGGGSISTLASPSIPTYSNGTKVTVKLEIQGINLRFKSWSSGTAEPSSWTATTTDSTYSSAGSGGFSNGGGTVDNVYFGPAETTFSGGFIAPVLSNGTTSSNSVQLQWTAATQSAGSITYQLMRSLHASNAFTEVSGASTSPATDATIEASTGYDYRVTASDGINSPVQSNVVTVTTSSRPGATTFTLTGPSTGFVDQPSAAFTVAPNGSFTGTLTITPSGGGLSPPIVLTFANSAQPQSFTITPVAMGTVLLTATNSGAMVNPSGLSYASTAIASYVAGSGQTIGVIGSSTITAVSSGNDIQSLAYTGDPDAFTLSFDGQTTAPIAVTATAPTEYGKYIIPVTVGTAYQIDFSLGYTAPGNGYKTDTYIQIFDGSKYVGGYVVSQDSSSSNYVVDYTFVDTTSANPGQTLNMKRLVAYTPTTTQLTAWVSCLTAGTAPFYPTGFQVNFDLILLTEVVSGTKTYWDDSNSGCFSLTAGTQGSNAGCPGCYDSERKYAQNMSPGGFVFSLASTTILSALEALSSVGTGNVSVTGSNPYQIQFTGSLAGAAQSLITSSSSAVTITHAVVGGQFATVTITPEGGSAGSPIPLKNVYWGSGVGMGSGGSNIAPYASYAMLLLPQSAPDHLFYGFNQGLSDYTGNWNIAGSGFCGLAWDTGDVGDVVTFSMQGIPPGEYQIAMICFNDPTLNDALGVAVTDSTSDATLLSTTVNQSIAPGSAEGDFILDGYTWRVIGNVTTTAPSTGFNVAMTTAGKTQIDTIMVTRLSTSQTVTIPPGATVELNTPAGFLSTANGPIPAFSATIPNYSGQSLYAPGGPWAVNLAVPPTMGIGYNMEPDGYAVPLLMFSDQVERLGTPMGNALASDANGYATLLSAPTSSNFIVGQNVDQYGLGHSFAAAPFGYWTVQWEGPDECSLTGSPNTEVMEYQNLTGSVKQRVFNFTQTYLNNCPGIFLNVTSASSADGSGHYAVSSNNFHIYPPDPSDPTGLTPWGLIGSATPPRIHPNFAAMLQGAAALRFLGWMDTNEDLVGKYTDIRQPGMLSGYRTTTATITSITNYVAPALSDPTGSMILQLTGTGFLEAGFFDGQSCNLNIGSQVLNLSGSAGTLTGNIGGTNPGYSISIVSDTEVQFLVGYLPSGTTITNTLSSGTLTGQVYTPQTFQDCIAACNAAGADCWMNHPLSGNEACHTWMANYAAANLNPGLKYLVEAGNECWNYTFQTFRRCQVLSYRTVGSEADVQVGHIVLAKQIHAWVLAAFTAVGRASDVVRVLGTQAGNIGITNDLISLANSYSAPFDVITPSFYFVPQNIVGGEVSLQPITDLMTPYGTPLQSPDTTGGQSTDFYEVMVQYNGESAVTFPPIRAALDTAGLTNVKIWAYEAGTDVVVPERSVVNSPFRSHSVIRHPRCFWWNLGMMRVAQNDGCSRLMKFFSTDTEPANGTFPNISIEEWSTYNAWNQGFGTGDTTVDVANTQTPERVDLIQSEMGGSIRYWNSLVPATTTRSAPAVVSRQTVAKGVSSRGRKHV